MTAARTRRVDRLEETAALRAAEEMALEFGLTEDETVDLIRDTRRVLVRWQARLPISLDWILDGTTAEYGLSAEERADLDAKLRNLLAAHEQGSG